MGEILKGDKGIIGENGALGKGCGRQALDERLGTLDSSLRSPVSGPKRIPVKI